MRRSKEIHLVNISFIDMLAGALGAVILLYVLVPKVSFAEIEKLKVLDSLSMQANSMDSLLAMLESVVPEAEYQDLMKSSASLQASIEVLKVEVLDVQNALKKRTDQFNHLVTKHEALQKQNASLQSQLKNAPSLSQYNKMAAELKAQKEKASALEKVAQKPAPAPKPSSAPSVASTDKPEPASPVRDETPGVGDAIFGIDPPLTVMINWENPKDKVHLYMRQAGGSNWVFYQTKRRRAAFGTWDNTLKKLTSKPYEAIVQRDGLVPGEYEIYAQPFKTENGKAEVSGFIAMKIADKPVKRFNLSPRVINDAKPPYTSGSNETLLGRLSVTAEDISWTPN